jgi:hypothetical protein
LSLGSSSKILQNVILFYAYPKMMHGTFHPNPGVWGIIAQPPQKHLPNNSKAKTGITFMHIGL